MSDFKDKQKEIIQNARMGVHNDQHREYDMPQETPRHSITLDLTQEEIDATVDLFNDRIDKHKKLIKAAQNRGYDNVGKRMDTIERHQKEIEKHQLILDRICEEAQW